MKFKKYINGLAYILILVAVVSSVYIANMRVDRERNYKNVEMLLNSSELDSLANANDLTLDELIPELKERGVTGVLVKELSLGDLKRAGKITYYQGEEINFAPNKEKLPADIPTNYGNIIITINDKSYEDQIISNLQQKFNGAKDIKGEVSVVVLPSYIPNSDKEKEKIYEDIDAYGVGFDINQLKKYTDLGLDIAPQVRDWKNITDDSLAFMADEIKSIPSLSFIMFNDTKVPGYPEKMRYFGDLLKDEKGEPIAPIGTVEFFNQKGVPQFASYLNKEAVRVHSISFSEMSQKSAKEAVDRFELAVSERNIRAMFVRLFDMLDPAGSLDKNLDYLESLKTAIEAQGFTFTKGEQYPSLVYYNLMILLIGLGVIAGGALIVTHMKQPTLALILAVLGALAWVFILYKQPIMARKLMALASVIVFPILAFLKVIKAEKRSLLKSIFAFLKLSGISFLGAVLMVGLLSDKLFMLKLDQFIGIKIAHIIPLLVVPALLHDYKETGLGNVRKLLEKAITYRVALISGVALVAVAIYVLRTGNVSTEMVSGFEQHMRDVLRDILGVRPRTKEFLIGHPFALMILFYGIHKKNWYLVLPAVIGQVSLVNTYAHIHTPLLISLVRSFNGLWIGIIGGIVLIAAWQVIDKLLKKYELLSE